MQPFSICIWLVEVLASATRSLVKKSTFLNVNTTYSSQMQHIFSLFEGRQCVASAFFLQNQYEDALLYLNSIRSYLSSDDTFKFNLAQVSFKIMIQFK